MSEGHKVTLTDEDRRELDTFSTSHISDAMEWLDLPRTVVPGFKFVGQPHAKMFGPAVTARQVPKSHGDPKTEQLVRHVELTKGVAGKGDVAIVDVGGRLDVGTWGEFQTYRCLLNGVAGIVINGCIRDAAMVRDSGMPVLCRGLNPIKSLWDLKTAEINKPVMLGTVCVRPGDIVFGDEDGLVVIAPELKDRVIEKAREIRDFEDEEREMQFGRLGLGADGGTSKTK